MNVEKRFTEIRDLLVLRRNESAKWLEVHAPEVIAEEKHLTKNVTAERCYFRYGYYAAMCDILNQMENIS
jgi:hypothetical protein